MADVALVLSADHYSITDQGTGQLQQLHQVWFITEYRESNDREYGSKPVKMIVDAAVFAELVKHPLPGLFELDLRSRPGKGNAAALTVVGFKAIGTPSIFPTLTKKAA